MDEAREVAARQFIAVYGCSLCDRVRLAKHEAAASPSCDGGPGNPDDLHSVTSMERIGSLSLDIL